MASKKFDTAKTATQAAGDSAKSIIIRQPERGRVALEVTFTADLIQHNFDQKTIEQMLRKHMGLPNPRETKKPRECIEAATIRNTKGENVIPSTAFKKGMLTAAAALGDKNLPKTMLRTSVFIVGRSIPFTYSAMVPRMDLVRCSGMSRAPDVRFRPSFTDVKACLVISFDTKRLKVQTIVDLLNRAGDVGVGEWRPEKDGTFGTYKVTRNIDDPKEVGRVIAACEPALVPLTIPDWAMDAEINPDLLRKIAGGESTGGEDSVKGEVHRVPASMLDRDVEAEEVAEEVGEDDE